MRFRFLLTVLVVAILAMPVIAQFTGFDTTPVGLSVIVLGALFASGRSGCRTALIPVAAVLGLVWLCALNPESSFEGVHLLAVAGLHFFSISITLLYLKGRQEIDQEALAAAASVYLLFGIACGAIYAAFEVWLPGGLEFATLTRDPGLYDHVYFSFVVLTTIGFGDVVPVDALNRSMAMLEGIIGLFYVAVIISRLVSLYRKPEG